MSRRQIERDDAQKTLLRRLHGESGDNDAARLEALRREDPSFDREARRVEAIWRGLDQVDPASEGSDAVDVAADVIARIVVQIEANEASANPFATPVWSRAVAVLALEVGLAGGLRIGTLSHDLPVVQPAPSNARAGVVSGTALDEIFPLEPEADADTLAEQWRLAFEASADESLLLGDDT